MVVTLKRGLRFAAALAVVTWRVAAVTSASGSAVTCPGNTPVEQRSCTLELDAGSEAQFQCANPSPKSFPSKMLDWNGAEKTIADLFGEGSSAEHVSGTTYKIKISDSAKASVGGLTCAAVSPTTSQQPTGTPTLQEAEKLLVRSLVVRVAGGPEYAQERIFSQQDNAVPSTAEGVNAVVTSALLAAAAFVVAV
ncbi:hypothetical protein Emag_004882 [Eimeria magna]